MRVTPRAVPSVEPALEKQFRSFVLAAFGLRRKQLIRVVRTVASLDAERAAAVLQEAGLPNDVRPETLTPADFARLVRVLTPLRDPAARS